MTRKQQSKSAEVVRDENGRVRKGTPNPGGMTKEQRERRKSVAEALEKAFVGPDGQDMLIDAIVDGVMSGDGMCIKLACEYRYGKPVQRVEISPEKMEDDELKRAVVDVVEQWKQEGVAH